MGRPEEESKEGRPEHEEAQSPQGPSDADDQKGLPQKDQQKTGRENQTDQKSYTEVHLISFDSRLSMPRLVDDRPGYVFAPVIFRISIYIARKYLSDRAEILLRLAGRFFHNTRTMESNESYRRFETYPGGTMRQTTFLLIMILICCFMSSRSQEADDVLQVVLDSAGFSRDDLGYAQKGYWSRFPLDIPYRLTSFDDLFAEPLKLYDYSKTMASAVEKYLDPSFMDTSSLSLYYLTYSVGVDRKLGGFRNYSANLKEISDSTAPLTAAVESLFDLAQENSQQRFLAQKVKWEEARPGVKKASERLPRAARRIVARLLVNIADAVRWRNYAFRRCRRQKMDKTFKIDDLALTQADGQKYYPELDDIASVIDYPSLHYAALKCAAIVQETTD
jgi:hypothetical protein